MKKFDLYDLIISSEGFQIDGISDKDISNNLNEINKLKEDLGIKIEENPFMLILFDDMEHNHLEVLEDLTSIGLGERAIDIINEAEQIGDAFLMSGKYEELKKKQDILKRENYKTVIKRIDRGRNE